MDGHYANLRSLPTDYLWCRRCNRSGGFKPASAFSNRCKTNAANHLTRGGRMGDRRMLEILMCIQCTGGRKTEMLCTGDNRMHALEEFSKSQRNDPDNALCRRCMALQQNVRPGPLAPEEPDAEIQVQSTETTDVSSITSELGGVALYPTDGFRGTSLYDAGRYSDVTTTIRSDPLPSSFDGSKYNDSRSDSISIADSGTGRSEASTINAGQQTSEYKVHPSGFVKIRKGFREEPVPAQKDDDYDLAEDFDSDEEWDM